MKKISVDETTFNKAVMQGKLEVAEWLFEIGCPVNSTAYFQNMNIEVLYWLLQKNIIVDEGSLQYAIEKTSNLDILKWFIDQGVDVDCAAINSCMRNNKLELLDYLLLNYQVSLTSDNYCKAVVIENIGILDILKRHSCPFSEDVINIAMKHSKKLSLKWLLENGFF